MRITLEFYGPLRQAAGGRRAEIVVEESPADVRALKAEVSRALPQLAPYLATTAISIDNTIVRDGTKLGRLDTVALLPPVSGG